MGDDGTGRMNRAKRRENSLYNYKVLYCIIRGYEVPDAIQMGSSSKRAQPSKLQKRW